MTFTSSSTFTRTNAREIASKVATDLEYFKILYDEPSDADIASYDAELTELLAGGYVERVTYGFKRNDTWVAALRYEVRLDGTIQNDDLAGRIRGIMGKDVTGAVFTSSLLFSQKWVSLSQAERDAIERILPFKRVTMPEPSTPGAYWAFDRSYSSGSGGVNRSTLKSL
jgi:hypothetical protein